MISFTSAISQCYGKRSDIANGITNSVADYSAALRHNSRMLGPQDLLTALERLKSDNVTTNAAIARLLNIPSSRVAEIFDGSRKIKFEEAKVLVEHFALDGVEPPAIPTPDLLEPLLDALLPLIPAGPMVAQSRRALAEALSYGLELIGSTHASPANADALQVAARAAVLRFRETGRSA